MSSSSRFSAAVFSLLPLALSAVALAFAITTLTSKEWAVRHQYSNGEILEEHWTTPIGTQYRSPFVVCGTAAADNGTGVDLVCVSYPAPGTNSCLPLRLAGSPSAANYGDERLCQQIHWAGNLAIASTVFIGVGFMVTLCMTLVTTLALLSPALIRAEDNCTDDSSAGGAEAKTDSRSSITERSRPRPLIRQRYLSPGAPYANAFLIMVSVLGAIMYFLAQCYGVLAFVQSQPDNASYALYGPANPNPNPSPLDHGPWIQGKALSVYGSVAWLGALLTALCAAWVWRLPSGRQSPL